MANSFNLLVLKSLNMDRAIKFYQKLGLEFEKHAHGKGPQHYSAEQENFVFEIYPAKNESDLTQNTRLGLSVTGIVKTVEALKAIDVEVISEPRQSLWGLRSVVRDLDGHVVELIEKNAEA